MRIMLIYLSNYLMI